VPEGRIGVLSAVGTTASNLKEIALSTIIVQVVTVKALPSFALERDLKERGIAERHTNRSESHAEAGRVAERSEVGWVVLPVQVENVQKGIQKAPAQRVKGAVHHKNAG